MRKIIQPCGLHCMKVQHLGVTIGTQEILTDINLHIHCGTLNAVIGKNGAGKSTLVRAMLGELPYTGSIEFKDCEDGRLQKLKIGYVPQAVNIEKHTPVSVYDLIASYQSRFPVCLHKRKRLYASIKESLKLFEADAFIDKQVCNLSGGELQRVLLSLAVMDEPNLLLLDDLKQNFDLAVILISHDLDYVAKYADWVILLDKTVLKQGTVKDVYKSPEFGRVFGETEVRV